MIEYSVAVRKRKLDVLAADPGPIVHFEGYA